MEQKQHDELKQIFKNAATPRQEFANDLKSRVVSQANATKPKVHFFTRILMICAKPALKYGLAGFAVLAIIALPSYYFYSKQATPELTEEEQILANIAQANTELQPENQPNTDAITYSSMMREGGNADLKTRPIDVRTYNYKKSVETYTYGPAASSCVMVTPYQGIVTRSEYSEFYANSQAWNPSRSRAALYAGNRIYDYTLTVDNEQWQYRGGSYAVHLVNYEPMALYEAAMGMPAATEGVLSNQAETISQPVVTPNPREKIAAYFGDSAQVLGKEIWDGKEVYKIQWSYTASCAEPVVSGVEEVTAIGISPDKTLISVAYADTKTFVISSESVYVDVVTPDKLIFAREYSEESSNAATQESIREEFTFSFDVPLKTVDASTALYNTEHYTEIIKFAQANLPAVLSLKGPFTLQAISSMYVNTIQESQKHLIDRAFYSAQAYGETSYNENKEMFEPSREEGAAYPQLILSYEETDLSSYVNLSLLPATTPEQALEILDVDITEVEKRGEAKVLVNGVPQTGFVFEHVPAYGDTRPSSLDGTDLRTGTEGTDGEMPVESTSFREIYYIVTSSGVTGVAQVTLGKTDDVYKFAEKLLFGVISTADAARLKSALPKPPEGTAIPAF